MKGKRHTPGQVIRKLRDGDRRSNCTSTPARNSGSGRGRVCRVLSPRIGLGKVPFQR